jgi:hypothetical protein
MLSKVEMNSRELEALYYKRAEAFRRKAGVAPYQFALALHTVRIKNLDKMVYQKTPLPTKGGLRKGEVIVGDTVVNTAKYAAKRQNMRGDYKKHPGLSKKADWVNVSLVEVIPFIRSKQAAINRAILTGR